MDQPNVKITHKNICIETQIKYILFISGPYLRRYIRTNRRILEFTMHLKYMNVLNCGKSRQTGNVDTLCCLFLVQCVKRLKCQKRSSAVLALSLLCAYTIFCFGSHSVRTIHKHKHSTNQYITEFFVRFDVSSQLSHYIVTLIRSYTKILSGKPEYYPKIN